MAQGCAGPGASSTLPWMWLIEKHGTRVRRSWRKLHIAVDADTGRIVASELTTNDVDDGCRVEVPGTRHLPFRSRRAALSGSSAIADFCPHRSHRAALPQWALQDGPEADWTCRALVERYWLIRQHVFRTESGL